MIKRGCEPVEGEKVFLLSEEEFKEETYVAERLYRKLFLGGYCFRHNKTIFIREKRRFDIKLLCHERGHLRGMGHTWKIGYLMHPYGLLRGWKV